VYDSLCVHMFIKSIVQIFFLFTLGLIDFTRILL